MMTTRHAAKAGAHTVIHGTLHVAQFAQGVKIADEGHPRIGGATIAVDAIEMLGRAQKSGIDPNQRGFEAHPRRIDADVAAPGFSAMAGVS